ncbi:exocyst complex subunit Sec15-like-domain-containing protein [Lipomyces oligophaga]|uniref:exocyst complex subunit Sec15-like-domain-containing protein n=1 Tax=Lipomyces oligophaga TaxID=45792 RepID=UPI0034CDDD1E
MQHLQQVLLLNSDPVSLLHSIEGDDFLEQLAPVIEDAVNANSVEELIQHLTAVTAQKENEVQELCNGNQHEYTKAVHQLAKVKQSSEQMQTSVLDINQSVQRSGLSLLSRSKMLKDTRSARSRIDDTSTALRRCLKVLNMTNKIHELTVQKKYFQALKGLNDVQNHLDDVAEFDFAQKIRDSVPFMQDLIQRNVVGDLDAWLHAVREILPNIGKVAFDATEARRKRWKAKTEANPSLRVHKLNSAVELALEAQEGDEFDPLNNSNLRVDLTPFYECAHILSALGKLDEFSETYAQDRLKDQELILPQSLEFTDQNILPLETLLHTVCGFAILERVTVRKAYKLRLSGSVDGLWQSMCSRIAKLIDPVLPKLQNPETLLVVRQLLGLFIQTMESYEYSVERLNSYMFSLFDKYSSFLKVRFKQEFDNTIMHDDSMPMVIHKPELWKQIVSISWYKDHRDPSQVAFPCTLPFSQVYPLCCVEIRNFITQYYSFADEYTEQTPGEIESVLHKSIDELLTEVVCRVLRDKLKSSNREEIVQIYINLEYFELAAESVQKMLNTSSSVDLAEPVRLQAVEKFRETRKKAEQRIFELINSKIDDFLDIADYDWETTVRRNSSNPSVYLIDMVNFLEALVNNTLVNLPKSITSFIYFDAFDHLATSLLAMLLNAGRRISMDALYNFDNDIQYVEAFVSELGSPSSSSSSSSSITATAATTSSLAKTLTNGRNRAYSNGPNHQHSSAEDPMDNSLLTTFTELRQTIDLLVSPNMDEYNNPEIRMRKYSRVKPQNIIALIEKINAPPATPVKGRRYRVR